MRATQVVFGAGAKRATMMLVGEQPGDKEDLEGKPFVGPAGAMLQRALEEAGLRSGEIYLTNAVKHFSWEPRGKRRIHKKPRASEIRACRPWLEAEIEAVRPQVIVCLGATAAQSLLGPAVQADGPTRSAHHLAVRAGRRRNHSSVVDPARARR